ncbi:bifunctional metallophosphatase/5'-nucleotidase [Marinilabilia sp.]|uniref:bifunctional metallophosphatase/5'-nucleotidase n=1 Tax=Marinilabilia sp. TaxID=2021252 RepID=UPI0025B80087|nr:bifunctional metallophosphatase/5'-nucleotidase [Marinilabilia sp.]
MKKLSTFIIIMTMLAISGLRAQNDTISITVLQSADIHGQLDAHTELFREESGLEFRERGGLAHMKTLFDTGKTKNPNRTIIVDSGDLIQGSGYAAKSLGAVFPPIVQKMGYDLMIPGNWEVVYGKEVMMDVMTAYNTNVIVQNMKHDESNEPLFPPYWVTEIDGIRLAFIGINDPDVPVRQNPSFSKGIAFNQIDKEVEEIIHEVQTTENPDVVFLMTHIGIFKQINLANSEITKGVDYVLGSDTHERIRQPIQGKFAKVTEPGAFGSFVGKLTMNFVDGKLVSDEYELLEVDPEKYPANPEVAELITKAKRPWQEELETIVGYTAEPIYRYLTVETPMDNMITDALRWKTGADIALSNGFRFGNPIVPKNGEPAPITKADIWNMLPVNDHVKTGTVTGQQILDWLEKEMHNVFATNPMERFGGWLVRFSGMEVQFISDAPRGQRVQQVTINGTPLQKDKTYSLASCVRPGDPNHAICRLHKAENIEIEDYTLHEALEEYLRKHSPVHPKMDGRAKATDLGKYPFTTVPGTTYEFR